MAAAPLLRRTSGSSSSGTPDSPAALPPPGFVADRAEAAARVEHLLCYQFHDRALLEEALTHQSADGGGSAVAPSSSYQRLEFLGDAALGLAFSNFVLFTNPDLGPGSLSSLRAANISTEKLARVAVRHNLYPLLRRNCPRLDLLVGQFIESVKQEPEDDLGAVLYGGSVVKAPKVLADIVEAIAAAVYVDCKFDLEKLWKVIRWLFEPIITVETMDKQPVTTLHELCQKHGQVAQFKTSHKGGITTVNVFVGGELVGIGSSEQQVIAKLNAARDALGKLTSGANKKVLTTAVGNGSGVDIAELRECKQKLHEQCMRKHWPKPFFKIEKEEGPSHEREFVCSVQVETQSGISQMEIQDGISKKEVQNKIFITIGEPMSRVKDSENSAAQKMLEVLLNL